VPGGPPRRSRAPPSTCSARTRASDAGPLVAGLTPARVQASALGVLALACNLLGLFPGPLVSGMLADRLGLTTAMRLAPLVSLAVLAALAAGRRAYPESVRRIAARS
jgi:hypothetical protein